MAPNINFEFVEVNNDDKGQIQEEKVSDNEDEFDFPLFAAASTTTEPTIAEETRGRTIMKVSLREQSEERVVNERPDDFYFAKYTPEEKDQFAQCCVTGQDIYDQVFIRDSQTWKCIDLNKLNAKIELEINREKLKKKKNRPGKKKRELKNICRQRKLDKLKLIKLEEAKKKQQLKKQKYQKKNFSKTNFNKKQKPKPKGQPVNKPKYRTE
ncbi:hypothetical protein SBY92_004462 [Candida maltosa Xu316]